MKPYALDDLSKVDIGCCPGHDNPATRKYSGWYRSAAHKRAAKKRYERACRRRRRINKQDLKNSNHDND
jgi:hypothetical protein